MASLTNKDQEYFIALIWSLKDLERVFEQMINEAFNRGFGIFFVEGKKPAKEGHA